MRRAIRSGKRRDSRASGVRWRAGRSSGDSGMEASVNDPSNEWGYKFTQAARELGDRGIDYDDGLASAGRELVVGDGLLEHVALAL